MQDEPQHLAIPENKKTIKDYELFPKDSGTSEHLNKPLLANFGQLEHQ